MEHRTCLSSEAGGPSEAVSAGAGRGWLSGYNWIQGLPEREREREGGKERERAKC